MRDLAEGVRDRQVPRQDQEGASSPVRWNYDPPMAPERAQHPHCTNGAPKPPLRGGEISPERASYNPSYTTSPREPDAAAAASPDPITSLQKPHTIQFRIYRTIEPQIGDKPFDPPKGPLTPLARSRPFRS